MDFLLTYTDVLKIFLVLAIIIVTVILGTKYYFKKQSINHLKGKNKFQQTSLLKYNKYNEVDGFKFSGLFFRFGLFITLTGSFFSFSVTEFDRKPYALEFDEIPEEIEQLPPRIEFIKPLPPPPVNVAFTEVPEELDEDQPDFIDENIDENDVIDEFIQEEPVDTPAPPPPPQILDAIDDVEDIIVFAEQNPRFPGCEDINGSKQEKERCARKKLLEYIYENLTYPSLAVETGIEGTVVVQFVVNKIGQIENINLARGIGGGCDQEALKVVKDMNIKNLRWTPGRQSNKEVKVKFTLPIKFTLEN